MDPEIWQHTPRDIIEGILVHMPIDTRVHFRKEVGIPARKLQIPDNIKVMLDDLMKKRTPRLEELGGGTRIHSSSELPLEKTITLTVSTLSPCAAMMVPRVILSDVTYNIQVKKKKCVVSYLYMLMHSGWHCIENRFPLQ
jgi:hypothetical protein